MSLPPSAKSYTYLGTAASSVGWAGTVGTPAAASMTLTRP